MLENWQFNEPGCLLVTDGEIEQEYRLTFKTMSAFDEAKFRRKRSQAFAILDEQFGVDAERTDEQKDDAWILLDLLVKHAAVISALASVEVKAGDEWQPAKLPDLWYDAKQFAYNVPGGIIDPLFEAVIEAGNPARLFMFLPATDDEKKMLRLTVRPSEN